MRVILAPLMALLAAAASAQTVTLSGSMGDKALLVINGTPRTIAAGGSFQNVKVVKVEAGEALVELDGRRTVLRLGSAPVDLGAAPSAGAGSQIVLTAGSGGHFITEGSINGRAVQFIVDTGATMVAMSESTAQRIGLPYKDNPRGVMSTANGQVVVHRAMLDSVRVGDVQIYNVDAVVVPTMTDTVLLGNSFLTRFQMKRENDRLTLDRRN